MAHSPRGVSLMKAIFLSLLATAHADVIVRWNMYEGYDADAGANYGLTTHPNGGGEVVVSSEPYSGEVPSDCMSDCEADAHCNGFVTFGGFCYFRGVSAEEHLAETAVQMREEKRPAAGAVLYILYRPSAATLFDLHLTPDETLYGPAALVTLFTVVWCGVRRPISGPTFAFVAAFFVGLMALNEFCLASDGAVEAIDRRRVERVMVYTISLVVCLVVFGCGQIPEGEPLPPKEEMIFAAPATAAAAPATAAPIAAVKNDLNHNKACIVLARLLKQALNGVQQPAPRQGRAMV